MKYVERKFSLRVWKTDGTAKLLVGISAAGGIYIGKLIKIPVSKDEVLAVKITAKTQGAG